MAEGVELGRLPEDREAKRLALLAMVDDLHPTLVASADEAEARGTLPMATVDALESLGFFRLKLPTVLGGVEADPVTYLEVIEALAYIDTSAAWTTMIGNTSIALMGAFLPDEAIEQIFVDGEVPLAAAVTAPTGKATPVSGGHVLSGRWRFGSGIQHARWVGAGAFAPADDGEGQVQRLFAVPIEAVDVLDNWQVIGLRGTGSCDFTISEHFVPETFSYAFLTDPPLRGGPLYHIRHPGHTANEHAALALGTARRALDTIVGIAESKTRGAHTNPTRLASRQVFQRMIGEATLRLQGARMLTLDVYERAWIAVSAGETLTAQHHAEMRAIASFATAVAVDIATDAFRYCGGDALYDAGILQRCLRDVNSAAQHFAVSDVALENLGKFVLGLPDADPRA
jgi:alkylation response protein AidB-like acyl-CoA dehydrogenase